jgi:hypothetical protein
MGEKKGGQYWKNQQFFSGVKEFHRSSSK